MNTEEKEFQLFADITSLFIEVRALRAEVVALKEQSEQHLHNAERLSLANEALRNEARKCRESEIPQASKN